MAKSGQIRFLARTAARIRRLDEEARIVVFERSGFISYANCGLTYFIGDVSDAPRALIRESYACGMDRENG